MSESAKANLIIKGMVQGVFYRAGTVEQAAKLGLTGWVRNLANYEVEAVAEGDKEQIEKLIAWCRKGPPSARVDSVNVTWEEPAGKYDSFYVRG